MTKQAKTVVDVEVIEESAPKRKKVVKKSPKTAIVPVHRLGDDGNFDVSTLLPSERSQYQDIVQRLDEHDMGSLSTYGSDLQKAMDSYSSDFLKQRFDSKTSIESSELISNLLCEIKSVDLGDFEEMSKFKRFLSHIPVLRNCVMTLDKFKTKYYTIEQNIEGIVQKLEATRLRALRDNGLLEQQYNNNVSYIEQVGHLIIAGKIKSKELENSIAELQNEEANYKTSQEIANLQDYKAQLDKRISDLQILRYTFIQSLPQIKIIQKTNLTDANNTETQLAMTIPLWKNQMSLAVALYNQQQSLDIKEKVTNATNELLKKNSEMMKTQAIEVAKQNQRSVIDIETLRKTTADTLATIAGVQKAYAEGAEKRAKVEEDLKKLEEQIYSATMEIQKSVKHVVSKELKDTTLN